MSARRGATTGRLRGSRTAVALGCLLLVSQGYAPSLTGAVGYDAPPPWDPLPRLTTLQPTVILPQPSSPQRDEADEADGAAAAAVVVGVSSATVVPVPATGTGAQDIPFAALRAYRDAAAVMRVVSPACGVPWTLLAAVGRVESDHGRHAGSVLGADGVSRPAIVGVALDGTGPVARVADTDRGRYDGDRIWDRAVGPMQFLPSTWAAVAVDGDGDGVRSPDDIDDAALAAAVYLCTASTGVDQPGGMRRALFAYNPSARYVAMVMGQEEAYQSGGYTVAGDWSAQVLSTHLVLGSELGGGRGVVRAPEDRRSHGAATGPHGGKPRHGHNAGATPPNGGRDEGGTEQGGTEQGGTDEGGTDPSGTDPSGTDQGGTDEGGTDPSGTDPSGTDEGGTDPSGTEQGGTDPSGTDQGGTEPSGTDQAGTDQGGSSGSQAIGVAVTGSWTVCAPGFCLDGQAVDVGADDLLDVPAAEDYDGNGVTDAVREELSGLDGRTVDVLVDESQLVWVLLAINQMTYPGTPSTAASVDGANGIAGG